MTEHLNYAHFPDITPGWAFMRGGTVPSLKINVPLTISAKEPLLYYAPSVRFVQSMEVVKKHKDGLSEDILYQVQQGISWDRSLCLRFSH